MWEAHALMKFPLNLVYVSLLGNGKKRTRNEDKVNIEMRKFQGIGRLDI